MDTCCCYDCVVCGELLEPRNAMVVLKGELAEWSLEEEMLFVLFMLFLLVKLLLFVVVVVVMPMAKVVETWSKELAESMGCCDVVVLLSCECCVDVLLIVFLLCLVWHVFVCCVVQ